MNVVVIEPPQPVVTLEEAKRHLREYDDDQDEYIYGLIDAAQANLEGPGGWLGRCISMQTLEATFDSFDCLRLPYPPVVNVESITYYNGNDVSTVLPVESYGVYGNRVSPRYGKMWPATYWRDDAVTVRYTAGYEVVPPQIRQAILLLVGHWYAYREPVSTASINGIPFTVDALLSPLREGQI